MAKNDKKMKKIAKTDTICVSKMANFTAFFTQIHGKSAPLHRLFQPQSCISYFCPLLFTRKKNQILTHFAKTCTAHISDIAITIQ